MRELLALCAAIVSCVAVAGGEVIADGADGSHIRFSLEQSADCIDGARPAVWVSPDAQKRVKGCWAVQGSGLVVVALTNGKAYAVPIAAIREPEKS